MHCVERERFPLGNEGARGLLIELIFFSTCLCYYIRQTNSNVNMPGSDNSAKTQMSKPTDLKLNMSEKAPAMVPISSPSSAGKPGFCFKKKYSNLNAPFFLKCNVYDIYQNHSTQKLEN